MENESVINVPGCAAVIHLTKWLEQTGITASTAWRWRKAGLLKTVNIYGRVYLTQEAINEFSERAKRGEFAKPHKVPERKECLQ
jgi:predicted site-specific integrase-resolvase